MKNCSSSTGRHSVGAGRLERLEIPQGRSGVDRGRARFASRRRTEEISPSTRRLRLWCLAPLPVS